MSDEECRLCGRNRPDCDGQRPVGECLMFQPRESPPSKRKYVDVGMIVAEYLEKHGYDGLCDSDGECACLKSDLAPCGEVRMDCQAGWLTPCDDADGDFCITTDRPRVTAEEMQTSVAELTRLGMSNPAAPCCCPTPELISQNREEKP